MPLPSDTPKQFEMTCEMPWGWFRFDSNVSDWLGEGDSMQPRRVVRHQTSRESYGYCSVVRRGFVL